MKHLLLLFTVQMWMLQMQAQHFALANDKLNIVYLGVDNPISIAIENSPCNSIVLKVENGTIEGKNCQYIFRGKEIGASHITLYKKTSGYLKKIGQYSLRVKKVPPPDFKIGPYNNYSTFLVDKKVNKLVLASQEFVRADIENINIIARIEIDSFSVKIFHAETGRSDSFFNITGKINQQILTAFSSLKKDDIVLFHRIFVSSSSGLQWQLTPLTLVIDD